MRLPASERCVHVERYLPDQQIANMQWRQEVAKKKGETAAADQEKNTQLQNDATAFLDR